MLTPTVTYAGPAHPPATAKAAPPPVSDGSRVPAGPRAHRRRSLKATVSAHRLFAFVAASLMAASAIGASPALAADTAHSALAAERAVSYQPSNSTVFRGSPAGMTATAATASAHALKTPVAAVTNGAAHVGCWTWTPAIRATSSLGTLWQYNQGLYWCGNGSLITSRAAANDYPSNTGFGWMFSGNLNGWNNGGVGSYGWRHWNQGHFCQGAYFACIQNDHPWIDSTVYANGTGSYSASY